MLTKMMNKAGYDGYNKKIELYGDYENTISSDKGTQNKFISQMQINNSRIYKISIFF